VDVAPAQGISHWARQYPLRCCDGHPAFVGIAMISHWARHNIHCVAVSLT